MQQIRHILQLRAKKVSIREIKNATGVSRPTIRIYLNRWDAMGLPSDHLASLDDEALAAILYQEPQSAMDRERLDDLQVRIPKMLKDLSKTGVTRQLLWQEYRLQRPEGYGYTQFCEYLGGAAHRSKAVMHFEHKAGERLMIDFAGKKLHYVDPESGEQIACEVFLAVLPFSGYCYVEAVHSQRLEDFLGAIANAFVYLNGVTQAALIDNLKSGVIKPDRYEPKLTELLEQLSAHYNCTFMATRVYKPRDKASVERHVQIVYQRVYAPLRNETFTSLRGLNSAITERLAAHHALPFQQRRDECRRSLFDSQERQTLLPLPATAFEVKHSANYKVQQNYHVQLGRDRHFYSVPHEHIGKHVQVIYTRNTVEIYDQHRRIAFHQRDRRANAYSTVAEHMPPNHQHHATIKGYSAQYFLQRAVRTGPACVEVATRILEAKIFQQQTYLSCLGLLRLADKYAHERLE
ncbi:MAG: IS21 family transposase, partial [Saprospiraceae bacterium]|nr:IS21 family transposase [Saprospiraceae bacterium]